MSSRYQFWWWPWTGLFLLSRKLSRFLFGNGTWKSVEFEVPVISVHTFMTSPAPLPLLVVLKGFFESVNKRSAFFVNRTQRRGLKPQKAGSENAYFYSKPVGTLDRFYQTHHTVLSISEISGNDEKVEVVVLAHERFISAVRPKYRILVVDHAKPFYQEPFWPQGQKNETADKLDLADFMIVFNVPNHQEMDEVKKGMSEHLNYKNEIGIIFENELPVFEDILSHNLRDQLINIKDRDTFERSLIKMID